jgi:hypothetical protein
MISVVPPADTAFMIAFANGPGARLDGTEADVAA